MKYLPHISVFRRLVWLILFSILFLPPAVSQVNDAASRVFTTRDGLSSNHITEVVQDQRGFIWLATAEGLDRYDGTVFTAFYHKAGDKNTLPANTIGDMALLPGNRLVLATTEGLCLFNTVSGKGYTYRDQDHPDYYSFNNDFQFVRYDKYNHIWAGSRTGLYLFDEDLHLIKRWTNPSIKTNPYYYAELPFTYPDGAPGFLMNRVPYKYDPRKQALEKDRYLARMLHDHFTVDYITGNRYGIWWIYQHNDTLFHLDKSKRIRRYPISIAGKKHRLYSFLCVPRDSILWCGDNYGYLARFNMKQNKFLPGYLHFRNAPSIGTWVFTTCMFWDNQQNLWISTVNGLHRYSIQRPHIAVFDTSFYFRNAPVRTADVNAVLKSGTAYWVGTYGSGLFHIDPTRHLTRHFHFHFPFKETGRNWIWHIFPYSKDTLWLSTQDGLVWFNTHDHRYGMVQGHGLPSYIDTFTVMTMFKDSHDILWMGMSNSHGLIKYDLKTKQAHVYPKSLLPISDVSCITEDENGDLWMAFMYGGGLVHWERKDDHFSVIHAHAKPGFKDDKIYTIYADKQGSVWFSAGSDGLGQYDIRSGNFRIYGREQGLCSQLVNSITGNSDHLWIGTFNGLSRFNIHTRQFKNYSATDGFPGNYFIYVNCFDDRVYACGAMTMSIFKDTDLVNNPYAPEIYITDMLIQNKPVSFSPGKKVRIRYNQNYIRFNYTGINYINGKRNHYAYKLDGTGDGWVEAGNNRYAVYAGLAPGNYTFRVKAVNSAGTWSKNAAICSFTIVPPFWKTAWFFVIIFLVVFSAIYFFYRYRLHQVVRMQQIRDRIAADLHDDMGASLSNINIQSTMALLKPSRDQSGLKKMLENIRDDAQQMSEAIDDIVWSVNPENDSLDRILSRMRYYASDLFEAKNIRYVINFPTETNHTKLSMEKRRDFFLIFKEAVNNLVKHADCTHAVVEITLNGNRIKMELTDNGKGFDVEKEFDGNGLKNMQRRAKNIRAALYISSEAGKGTTLTLIL